ncbi:hypothetical protein [Microbacterium atlanticum]|uniref:hypothetical protein n=1 Tax=Microbacterium atlanticum TaxID=2782168 RepID=UPI001888AFFA|nr:hypothetical protein [Microbacterium atlanticum]
MLLTTTYTRTDAPSSAGQPREAMARLVPAKTADTHAPAPALRIASPLTVVKPHASEGLRDQDLLTT